MKVINIIEKYLTDNGYDGLYSPECGCKKDDLCPCGREGVMDCEAGYITKCDPETCPADGDCEWHIGPEKETEE